MYWSIVVCFTGRKMTINCKWLFVIIASLSLTTRGHCCGSSDSDQPDSPQLTSDNEIQYDCMSCYSVDDGTTCTKFVCPTQSRTAFNGGAQLVYLTQGRTAFNGDQLVYLRQGRTAFNGRDQLVCPRQARTAFNGRDQLICPRQARTAFNVNTNCAILNSL